MQIPVWAAETEQKPHPLIGVHEVQLDALCSHGPGAGQVEA